jgi:hypothetical protein
MLDGNETAASHLAGDEASGLQEFVCGCDGGTVQSKCTSQFAGSREALALRHLSRLDEAAKVRVKLPIDREGGGGVQLRLGDHEDSIP